jgi:hypothetical protein
MGDFMEPTSTGATGFILSKIFYGIAGLFGGVTLSFFWQPARLRKHGRVAAGAIVGGASVFCAVVFGGALSIFLGLDPHDANIALAIGGGVGILSVGIISFLANFFDKREHHDIVEVVQEIKAVATGTKSAPVRRSAPRRVSKVAKK